MAGFKLKLDDCCGAVV